MSKTRLIKRLSWYYPTERFHAYVTFPAILLFVWYTHPFLDVVFMSYGFLVCIVILYQGQRYWKLKLDALLGREFDQQKNLKFFGKWKKWNWILIAMIFPLFLFQVFLNKTVGTSDSALFWGTFINIFAVLEHINYYYIQLMVDNMYDVKYILTNCRLKRASLAKDLREGRI